MELLLDPRELMLFAPELGISPSKLVDILDLM